MNATTNLRQLFRERRAEIAEQIRTRPKATYDTIGKEYGISRERVRQIAKLFGLERRKQSGSQPAEEATR